MARATTTIRQLKNSDTGIDLAVTSIKEVKALIGSTFEYEVMVVSNLACFKNAKHKEADNVQFTVQKKFSDFEDLYTKLNTKYSGTVFPQLPRKVIKVNAQVAKERRPDLDQFLKFMAMTDKLSSCPLLLEFLGVSSVKAGNFRKPESMVVSEKGVPENTSPEEQEPEITHTEEDLFDDKNDDVDDDDLFSDHTIDIDNKGDTKIFDDVDLGGALNEEDSDLFVPDARSNVKGQVVLTPEPEDTDDLFNIDNDLEDLVRLGTKPTTQERTVTNSGRDTVSKPQVTKKPSIPANKPEVSKEESKTVKQKPSLPMKPKPSILQKPSVGVKPTISQKPDLMTKPPVVSIGLQAVAGGITNEPKDEGTSTADLSEDDIMKYIQENNANNDDDLDLFS